MSGNIRSDFSHGGEQRFLIQPGTRFLESEILHEGEGPARNKHISDPLPANLGVNPMKRGRREHRPELLAGKRRILKPGVHKFHRSGTFQVLPGECYKPLTGFERRDLQTPGEKAARELTGPAPDLKYPITAPDPSDLTSMVD
jgi:hypothetical protein